MRKLLLSGLFVAAMSLAASSARAQATLVQPAVSHDCGSAKTCTVALARSVTAGDSLIATVRVGGLTTNTGNTVSDSAGNTYAADGTVSSTDPHDDTVYRVASAKAGSTTFSITNSSASSVRITFMELSGLATGAADAVKTASGTGTSASVAVVTTQANDYVFAMVSSANSQTFTAGSGFKVETTATKLAAEDETDSATGSVTAALSLSTSDLWAEVAVAYKTTGAAPPISVTVSPTSASVAVNAGQNFTATVSNDTSGKGVTWALTGSGCSGSTCGALTSVTTTSVTYTAPTSVPSPATVTLTATSIANTTKSAAATITVTSATAAIKFVQVNSATPQTATSPVTVNYASAQTAGDLNIVVVGWNDSTATVKTVADSSGNVYALAVGPTVQTGLATQAIYYAANILAAAANANTVTVTFSVAAKAPDVRILEYSGLATASPLDVTAAAMATTGTSTNSGSATTTYANDLVFGANLVQTGTTAAGSGFTKRIITSPDGDIAEDEIVSSTGSYSATAPDSPSGAWIMQMAAFHAANSTPPPISVSVSPTTASVATNGAQNFTATILNDSKNNGVTWGLSGTGCSGATCGTLSNVTSTTVTYTGPTSVPSPATVTLTATSVTDTTKSATATITVTLPAAISVSVSPTPASVSVNTSLGFTATVSNDTSGNGVTWSLSGTGCSGSTCGSLSNVAKTTVTYTAPAAVPSPATVTLTATSVTDTTKSAAATITVTSISSIQFVQVNSSEPQIPLQAVGATYPSAQTAGDINIVAVGWNDSTATVTSVSDTSGNAYTLAVGPTIQTGVATQSIYYASNIAAAAANGNTVTVQFNTAANNVDLRILEYSGVATYNPLDVTAAGSGSGATSSSGAATTKYANELIFGANLVQYGTNGPGSGFTSRIITNPDGDIAEDEIVSAVGSYNATAPLTGSLQWIMQMATFIAAGAAGPPPVVVSVSPTTVSVGTGLPQNFAATIQNTSNTNVTWSLSGAGCAGSTCGTLNSTTANPVTYTAPASIPSPATVTIKATSAADNTKSATATITVETPVVAVSITPRQMGLVIGQTQTYTATITGTLNTAVTWYVDGTQNGSSTVGTLAVSGDTAVYTPPSTAGTHTILA
ncbi:MAG: hypothetical protein WCA98_11755, partial [Candidatus Acidiferrales bacterium]